MELELELTQQGSSYEVSSAPASDHSKSKHTIESRAKRSSKIISLGHDSTSLASSHTVKSKTDIKSPTHYPRGIEHPSDTTNESISVVASVSTASTKVLVSTLPNVDTLSDAVIYSLFASQSNSPQLDNDDLKQIDADDLEEMGLKWQMAMLTMRARRQKKNQPTNYAFMTFTSSSSSSSDNDLASCSKACLESVEARILVYQQNETIFEEDIKLLKLDVQLRNNALVELRKKFEKAEQERDEIKLKLENFKTSSKNLIFDRYQSGEGYHAVLPLYTGTFMPPKPDLVFHDALTINVTVPTAFNVKPSTTKPNKDLVKTHFS
nr:hypothetical protein [Tanacetum cinerariifolium]